MEIVRDCVVVCPACGRATRGGAAVGASDADGQQGERHKGQRSSHDAIDGDED